MSSSTYSATEAPGLGITGMFTRKARLYQQTASGQGPCRCSSAFGLSSAAGCLSPLLSMLPLIPIITRALQNTWSIRHPVLRRARRRLRWQRLRCWLLLLLVFLPRLRTQFSSANFAPFTPGARLPFSVSCAVCFVVAKTSAVAVEGLAM